MQNFYKLSDDMFKLVKVKEFKSWNTGLNSTDRKNLNRVSKALDLLGELDQLNVKSNTEHFFTNVKMLIKYFMLESGYMMSVNSKNKYAFKKIR